MYRARFGKWPHPQCSGSGQSAQQIDFRNQDKFSSLTERPTVELELSNEAPHSVLIFLYWLRSTHDYFCNSHNIHESMFNWFHRNDFVVPINRSDRCGKIIMTCRLDLTDPDFLFSQLKRDLNPAMFNVIGHFSSTLKTPREPAWLYLDQNLTWLI
jgi:hypothetical protein